MQDEDYWVEYKVLLLHVVNEEGRRKVVSEEQVVEQTEVASGCAGEQILVNIPRLW